MSCLVEFLYSIFDEQTTRVQIHLDGPSRELRIRDGKTSLSLQKGYSDWVAK